MATSKEIQAAGERLANGRRQLFETLLPVFIFLISFIPRLAAIDRYVTPDEPIWVYRSLGFRQSLLAADWANTLQSGHPGVTTTWLGTLAVQIQLWLQPDARASLDWIDRLYWLTPDNGEAMKHLSSFLTASRLGVLLALSLGLAAVFVLAKSRLGLWEALAAALLLALDPFAAGLGGLFHVDALLSVGMLIAVLLLLPRRVAQEGFDTYKWLGPDPLRMAAAGLFTGLAILTKTPGLYLLILAPLIVLWPSAPNGPYVRRFLKLVYWAVLMGLTILILLPATWSAPQHVWDVIADLNEQLVQSSIRPTFFLGEVTLRPGFIFYPLAAIFRLSPVATLGLLGLVFLSMADLIRRKKLDLPPNVLWLLVFGLGFLLVLNLSAKRFDRYALPALVFLTLIAGWSLVCIYNRYLANKKRRWIYPIFLGLLQIAYFFTYWPYPLTAFNWLAGGPYLAQHVLPTGWGEGTGAGAEWAAQLPDAQIRTLYTHNVPSASAFFPGAVRPLDLESLARIDSRDLILFDNQEWQSNPGLFESLASAETPLNSLSSTAAPTKTVSFNGLPRASLYTGITSEMLSLNNVNLESLELQFGDAVAIPSAGAVPAAWPDDIRAAVNWQAKRAADFQLQIALVEDDGYTRALQEMPLLNDVDHRSSFWPLNQTQTVYYTIPPPPDLPPGEYRLVARLFDQDGAGLGVFDAAGQFRGSSAELAALSLGSPSYQPEIEIPIQLENQLGLVGIGNLPKEIETGQMLDLDLWWQTSDDLPDEVLLSLYLDSITSGRTIDGEGMLHGLIYHIRASWMVPADLPAGTYPVSLQLADKEGTALWSKPVTIGEISVREVERNFSLPEGLAPLNIDLGTVGLLQGVRVDAEGNQIAVETVWQGRQADGVSYSVFLHLIGPDGNIIDQDDRPPAVTTDRWLPDQVISDRHTLTAPGTGTYQIAIGLYDPDTGIRLPMIGSDGRQIPDDQYLIKVTTP